MQEGDTELGGLQVPHGNNVNPPTPTPGPQPVVPAAPQNPQPTPQSSPQPTPQLSIPQSINQPVSQPAAQPPVQYIPRDTGDIMFTAARPKKSKKGLTIGLITLVALVVTIGVTITFYILHLFNVDNTKETTDLQDTFNKYANYIFYGEESTKQIQDSDTENTYYIDTNIDNNSFLETAKKLFDDFAEKFAYSKYASKSNISLFSTNDYYDFLIQRNNMARIDADKLFEIYYNDGLESAYNYINNYYANEESANYLMEILIDYDIRYNTSLVREWNIYDQEGCRREDYSYDMLCIENIPTEKIYSEATEIGDIKSLLESLVPQTVKEIKNQIWIYRKAIYEEDYSADVDNDEEVIVNE